MAPELIPVIITIMLFYAMLHPLNLNEIGTCFQILDPGEFGKVWTEYPPSEEFGA